MIRTLLARGLLLGLLAGLVAGAFAFAMGEPRIDDAIALEEAAAAAEPAHGLGPPAATSMSTGTRRPEAGTITVRR